MSQVVNHSRWEAYAQQFKTEFRRGNFEEASSTLNSALSDAEAAGEIDPVLIWCVHSLSGRYCAQGDYPAASRLLRRGLEIKEKILGKHHPDVMNSLEKLALFQLKILDKPELALALSDEADTSLFPQLSPPISFTAPMPKALNKGPIVSYASRVLSKLFAALG